MCGRYTHLFTWKQLHRLLGLVTPEVEIPRRFNVAPTQSAPIVIHDAALGGPGLRFCRWGLVPSWAKDQGVGSSLINARAEGIEGKPSFRSAFRRRRCVVPISGFYEWAVVEAPRGSRGGAGKAVKQPMYIAPADPVAGPWLLAGLWESWSPPTGERVETYTIITTTPNAMLAKIHDRMPVILGPDGALAWLAPGSGAHGEPSSEETARLLALLVPSEPESMFSTPVSRVVNSPKNDGPECVQPVVPQTFMGLFGPDT